MPEPNRSQLLKVNESLNGKVQKILTFFFYIEFLFPERMSN